MNLGILGKIGLLLVVIGFFMPIACDDNGFEIAKSLMKFDKTKFKAILMYVMFFSAAVGVVLGVLAFLGKGLDGRIDWLAIILCILSGIIIVVSTDINWKKVFNNMDIGGYFIFIGWILAVAGQLLGSRR